MIEDKSVILARWELLGVLKRGCPQCKEFYDSPDPYNVRAPSHKASPKCESGKKPHCTCDTCF